MEYKQSKLQRPHYIQTIYDQLAVIMHEALKDDTTYERTEELHRQAKELGNKKRTILKAMRKQYDPQTYNELFFRYYIQ